MITYQQIVGTKSDPIEAIDLDTTPQNIAHHGPTIPVAVIGVQLGTAAVAASLCYDRANSTASLIRVRTNSGSTSDWLLIPIYGRYV